MSKFDDKLKEIFIGLYNRHDNGRFKSLINKSKVATNLKRGEMWASFTKDFNAVAGTTFNKKQLQNLHNRIKEDIRERFNERAIINKLTKEANRTGSGPARQLNVPGTECSMNLVLKTVADPVDISG